MPRGEDESLIIELILSPAYFPPKNKDMFNNRNQKTKNKIQKEHVKIWPLTRCFNELEGASLANGQRGVAPSCVCVDVVSFDIDKSRNR